MKNVLITNVYSYKNKGDATIVISLIHEIKRVLRPSSISIQTTDIMGDRDKYGIDDIGPTILWTLFSSVRNRPIIVRILLLIKNCLELFISIAVSVLFKRILYIGINPLQRKYFQQIDKASIVIACGGGYLRTARKSFHDSMLLFFTCLNFYIPKTFGKKVFMYSQSIGPIHGDIQRKILIFFLNRVDLILSREEISSDYLSLLKIKAPFYQVSDAAFSFYDIKENKKETFSLGNQLSPSLNIGITVRNWFKSEKRQYIYEKSVANLIDYAHKKYKATSFYFPQVIADDFGDDDRVSAYRMQNLLEEKNAFVVVDQDLHPTQLLSFAKEMDVFIGTRMHSNIFSLMAHTPVIAIEYEHKTRGIMKDMEKEEFVININDIKKDVIIEKFEEVYLNRIKYKEHIKKRLIPVVKESQKAMNIIRDFLIAKTD